MFDKNNKVSYIKDGIEIGAVEYEIVNENTINIYHTYVNPDYQGQKIASNLVKYLFEKLKKEEKKAIINCSYVKSWLDKNKEYNQQVIKK